MNGTRPAKGYTMSFHDITYQIKQKENDSVVCGPTYDREILCGISGVLPPGLNAIMGPTGSGKTSLLDVLAQRKDPAGLTNGCVLMNGEALPKAFRLMSGYVVQDDIVMGTLTVRENIAFSANLRLSNSQVSLKGRQKKVQQVIEELGLTACADTPVGNEFVRGVSGGERKRVNIAMELILDPPVLFLDEPTTGLDSNTANTIILLLYKIARGGKNIILSIHQPRYSIYSLFDRLLLLNKGNVVYSGPAQSAVNYFDQIGYKCPTHYNPPDYFLDIVGGDVNTAQLLSHMSKDDNKEEKKDTKNDITLAIEADEKCDNSQSLYDAYSASKICADENECLQKLNNNPHSTNVQMRNANYLSRWQDMDLPYQNSFATQMKQVCGRAFLNLIRNPMTSTVQIFTTTMMAILIGTIYFQMDLSLPDGLQNRAGLFFFLVTSQVMSNLTALQVFIDNRKFFIHESASGYYRASVYFFSQILVDIIPNRIFPNLVFSLVLYFMAGLQLDVGKFFIFFLALLSTAFSATSIAFLASASVESFAVANAVVALPYILMMLFGGFLANVDSILPWLAWMKWFSIFRYGSNALQVNEMTGLVFHNNQTGQIVTGEEYLMEQGIPYGTWGLWQNIVAMWGISIGFVVFSYVQLRRINKYK